MASGCQPRDLKCNRPGKQIKPRQIIKEYFASSAIQYNVNKMSIKLGYQVIGSCRYLSDSDGNVNWNLPNDVDLLHYQKEFNLNPKPYPELVYGKTCHFITYYNRDHAIYMTTTLVDNIILWIHKGLDTLDIYNKDKMYKKFMELLYYYEENDNIRLSILNKFVNPFRQSWIDDYIKDYQYKMDYLLNLSFQEKCNMVIKRFTVEQL